MTDIKTLIKQVHQEAKKEDFPIDTLIYQEAKKTPLNQFCMQVIWLVSYAFLAGI